MTMERDRHHDGEVPPENRLDDERRRLREIEERARFESRRQETPIPTEGRREPVVLRSVTPDELSDEAAEFRIQHGSRDVGAMSLEHDQEKRVTTLVDFKIGDPRDRGQGIGSESLRQAESSARARGMSEMRGELSRVDTDIDGEDPARARDRLAGFYRRNGYEVETHDDEHQPMFGSFRKKL